MHFHKSSFSTTLYLLYSTAPTVRCAFKTYKQASRQTEPWVAQPKGGAGGWLGRLGGDGGTGTMWLSRWMGSYV
eukprot:319368-Prymnesium_polylepis.1